MQVVDSRLMDRRRRKLWDQPMLTPVARHTVRCPPTADALFPALSREARRRPGDMSARNQRLHRASKRTTCTWCAGPPAANGVSVWNESTQINTNKSTYSEMDPVWRNPIQRTVRTANISVHCLWLHSFSIHNMNEWMNKSD